MLAPEDFDVIGSTCGDAPLPIGSYGATLLQHVTPYNSGLLSSGFPHSMPVLIRGMPFFSISEVLLESGVSRQTLWRWRREGRVPPGYRFRDGQVLFTSAEVEAILLYRDQLVPLPTPQFVDPGTESFSGVCR